MASGQTSQICCPINFGDLMMRPDGTRLKGIMGERMMPYIDSIKRLYNFTFIFKENPAVGHRIDSSDSFTGCLGELQREESDFVLQGMDYPVNVVNVSQGVTILDDRISYLGGFVRPDAFRAAEFTNSLKTFHWSLYLLIAVYIYTLFIVLRVYRVMRVSIIRLRAKKPPFNGMARTTFWLRGAVGPRGAQLYDTETMIKKYKKRFGVSMLDVVSHFLGTNNIGRRSSFFVGLITLLISCFSFFIFTYYYSLLNTELVSSVPANIHENYRDLMKRNVKPLFFEGTIYSQQLKHANEGTPERELWDWAVAKYGEKNLYVTQNYRQLASVMPQGILGNLVFFTGGTLTGPIKTAFCRILSRSWERMIGILGIYTRLDVDLTKYDDWQIYTRSSESAKNAIKTFVVGKRLQENPNLFKMVNNHFPRLIEMGLVQAELRSFERMDLFSNPTIQNLIGPPVPDRSEMKHRCQENNVLVPKLPEVDRLMPSYFLLSFKVLVSILFIALCCLLGEKVHYSVYSTRKARRKPRARSHTSQKNVALPERRRINTLRRSSL